MASNTTSNQPSTYDPSVFATPRFVESPDECSFYHVVDLPGVGEVGREWDLRENIGDYLGNVEFQGKRVLDIGTAAGYLTFEMERRGADVVSFDMASGEQWNLVPHYKLAPRREKIVEQMIRGHRELQNAYWFSHRLLGSQAKVFYGDVYDISEKIGNFDVVMFGMILSHLRDPFQALYSGSRLSTDTVIVTNQVRTSDIPECKFLPSAKDEKQMRGWWSFSDTCIERMLGVLGFQVESKTNQQFKCIARGEPRLHSCTTFVARRIECGTEAKPSSTRAA